MPAPVHRALVRPALSLLAVALLVTASPSPASAHPEKGGAFGIGVTLFDPSGFTLKYFTAKDQALSLGVGAHSWYYRGGWAEFQTVFDYTFHFRLPVRNQVLAVALYAGPGLSLLIDPDGHYCNKFTCYDRKYGGKGVSGWFGVRGPFGAALWFKKFAGEVFIEIAPTLYFVREIGFDFDFALGFRYYF